MCRVAPHARVQPAGWTPPETRPQLGETNGVRLGRPPTMAKAVVRRIQRQRAQGDSLRKIAEDLDEDGVPTAQGGAQRYAATVRHVLLRTA